MSRQYPTLRKYAEKEDYVSAEWAVVEVPGLILSKDSNHWTPEQDRDAAVTWSWQFYVLDLLDPNDLQRWPDCECNYGFNLKTLHSPDIYHAAKKLIKPIESQQYPTRREALQALRVVLELAHWES